MTNFGFWTTYAFTINFIVGVGILDIPQKFYRAGWLLSLLSLCASCALLCVTMLWTVDALARALGVSALLMREQSAGGGVEAINLTMSDEASTIASNEVASTHSDGISRPLLAGGAHAVAATAAVATAATASNASPSALAAAAATSGAPLSERVAVLLRRPRTTSIVAHDDVFCMDGDGAAEVVRTNRGALYALNELLAIFCPPWAKTCYELSIAALLLMSLWAFTVVFSRSAVSKFSLFDGGGDCSNIAHFSAGCDWSFRVFVAVFGVVCISMSLLDFEEMVTYQLILTVARFALIGVFVFVSLVGVYTDPIDNHSSRQAPPYVSDVPAVNASGLIGVFSTGLFAQLVNFGAPDLIAPMSRRVDGFKVMLAALVSTAVMYAAVGAACALYFGAAIESQVNVNFSHYRGGARADDAVPWWATAIAYYAALFPALDVISMFPLCCVSLASTWRATLLAHSAAARQASPRALRAFCRLTVAVPPVVLTLFARDLDVIINYAVLPGAFIALVAPLLLQHYSSAACVALGVLPATPHSVDALSGPVAEGVVALLTAGLYAALVYSLVTG